MISVERGGATRFSGLGFFCYICPIIFFTERRAGMQKVTQRLETLAQGLFLVSTLVMAGMTVALVVKVNEAVKALFGTGLW
jgi:hypothetical protein